MPSSILVLWWPISLLYQKHIESTAPSSKLSKTNHLQLFNMSNVIIFFEDFANNSSNVLQTCQP